MICMRMLSSFLKRTFQWGGLALPELKQARKIKIRYIPVEVRFNSPDSKTNGGMYILQ